MKQYNKVFVSNKVFCITGGLRQSSVTQASHSEVTPSSKPTRRIEPRQTTENTSTTYVATIQKTQPPYLLVATSVGYSIICGSQLRSPGDVSMSPTGGTGQILRSQPSCLIVDTSVGNSVGNSHQYQPKSPESAGAFRTTVATRVLKSQPSYLILASAGNSVGNSVNGSHQSVPKSPSSMGVKQASTASPVSIGSIYVVSRSPGSSVSVSSTASLPFLAANAGGDSNVVLQPTSVQSSHGVVATLLLPATPLVRIITNGSAQYPAVQYVVNSPTAQAAAMLQSPPASVSVASLVQTSSSSNGIKPVMNLQASPLRQAPSVGNAKLTAAELSSSGFCPVANYRSPIIRPPLGNSAQSAVVLQECLPASSSRMSNVVGSPVSAVVWPSCVNTETNVVQQSPSYCVPMGNSKSSGIVGIPVSLSNSALPQIVLVGQNAGLTAVSPPKPQLLRHSSSAVSSSS